MRESYKLSPFLSSPRKQKQSTSATNKLGKELNEAMRLSLDEINKRIVEVGISFGKKADDTRVYIDVKEVSTSLRASKKCSADMRYKG